MSLVLKNKYFLLRHGRNNHQAEKPDLTYLYPDNDPPCFLIEEGIEQVRKAGELLKQKGIDLIYSSDVLRTRQTAKIVAEMLGLDEIIYDTRLRDINWGIFSGKEKKEAWGFFNNDGMKRFDSPAPQGESWNQCLERMTSFLKEIEDNFQNKKVLIVSHGDPLWLLEGYVKGLTKEELARERKEKGTLDTGEVREL
jgi:broad specificity phosphatase PhoE